MARQFDIGRQNEILLNEETYNLYKVLEHYLSSPNQNNPSSGPVTISKEKDPIMNKALWLDNFDNPKNAELKFYNNGEWHTIFKNKFQIIENILDSEEPSNPIRGQLWVNKEGIMHYYSQGYFKPIKATQADISDIDIQGFEDFLIISPLEEQGSEIINNFTEMIFADIPLTAWENNKNYEVGQGCINDLHIYVCNSQHLSSNIEELENTEMWTRMEYLRQFLIPNADYAKVFFDGNYVHQKIGYSNDENEKGYKVDSNISISFPKEEVEDKLILATHVNPKRLNNIVKKFFKIDKNNPVIEMEEENTEFYVVRNGIGKLLIKTDKEDTEYFSVVSNGYNCIKLSPNIYMNYDFIYAIHYEFLTDFSGKQKGSLNRKKIRLNEDNSIWIGSTQPERIVVFAQGLLYEESEENYVYDAETGYLHIKERFQDNPNVVKQLDFSVLSMPEVYQGAVNNNFTEKGFRINLPSTPKSENFVAFVAGVQIDSNEVIDDPKNPRVKYITAITEELWNNYNRDLYWAIIGTDERDQSDNVSHAMYRGTTTAVKKGSLGNVVPIYRDRTRPVEGALFLDIEEKPIMFVDGVLVFQKECEVGNDYISIYGLEEGQNVLLLADTKANVGQEDEDTDIDDNINSERLLFEDTVSFSTVTTPLCDDHVVFVQNGILCDASATYTSIEPKSQGYHGELRYYINRSEQKWLQFNALEKRWIEINDNEIYVDESTGEEERLVDYIDKNARSYSSTRRSISFLQRFDNEYCTYYGYKYTDSIEKKLLMDCVYPNGRDGINTKYNSSDVDNPKPFLVNFKHTYIPGKNELTVYLNGVRQNLNNPYDIGFNNSTNRECSTDQTNNFILAIDNGTKEGEALPEFEGYYAYEIEKNNISDVIYKETELTNDEIETYREEGYSIELINSPKRNEIFYVIEPCEGEETKACDIKTLTYENAFANKGAFADNSYDTDGFILTRGNIRVFVNGIRQPYGSYQTLESLNRDSREMLYSYKIINSTTIQFSDVLIGGFGGNEAIEDENPKFPIGNIVDENNKLTRVYYNNIDEIVIEMRRDYKIREKTIPIYDNSGEFSTEDGLPSDLFKTKDRILIYINGLAYGKKYELENNYIKLLDKDVLSQLELKRDVITFEWR